MKQKLSLGQSYLLLALFPAYFMIVGAFYAAAFRDSLWSSFHYTGAGFSDYRLFRYRRNRSRVSQCRTHYSCLTFVLYQLRMEIDGHTLTSCCLIFGFFPLWKKCSQYLVDPPRVYLYAHYHRTSIRSYLYVGLYGTSLSPIITQVMQLESLSLAVRIPLSFLIGITIGFVLPPLSTHVHFAHQAIPCTM